MMRRILIPAVVAIAVASGCSKSTSPSAADKTPAQSGVSALPPVSQVVEPSQSPSVVQETPGQPLPKPISAWSSGKSYYGVYVAVEPTQNASIDEAVKRMEGLGLRKFEGTGFSNGSLGCDYGAAAQLGVPKNSVYVAVYFKTEADATTFAASLEPPPVGIARVTFGCAD